MKQLKSLCCLFSILFCHSVYAEVTLTFPDSFKLYVVNEQEAEIDGSFFSSTAGATLPNGENQIVFRYKPSFREGADRFQVTGDVIIAKFTAENTKLTVNLPNYKNKSVALDQIRDMEWSLEDEDGNKIAIQQDKLEKSGMQMARNYVDEAKDYNRDQAGIAAIVTVANATPTPTTKMTTQQPASKTSSNSAEEMLHFWYAKADDATKARFKAFVNSQ